MSVPAIVLAAGASRRLGQPKQLVRIDGESLLARTLRVTRQAGFAPIGVVLGAHAEIILKEEILSNVSVVMNHGWEQGIATSIQAGVRWLQRDCPHADGAILLVCDQPGLTAQHLEALLSSYHAGNGSKIAASTYAGIRAVPAILPSRYFDTLCGLRGDQGARRLLQNAGSAIVEVPFADGVVDIDTPSDLAKYTGTING